MTNETNTARKIADALNRAAEARRGGWVMLAWHFLLQAASYRGNEHCAKVASHCRGS